MPDFNEELLQFIWRHRLLKPQPLISTSGNAITLLKQGDLNNDSGPDFFNGHIIVSGVQLIGNIEIHLRTSDWLKHRHQEDRSYDNIILHVVYEHDVELSQNTENNVEVLELRSLIDDRTLQTYRELAANPEKLACSGQLSSLDDFKFRMWIERMTVERLKEKLKRSESLFRIFHGDYTQTFYSLLVRNFGFKVNAIPFELLAKHLPVQLLLKHADALLQLEALLLGTAGFLDTQLEDPYLRKLQNEFQFLSEKYKLIPLRKEIFKFSKLRPANFPTIRLAQLARLIHTQSEIFIHPHQFVTSQQINKALTIQLEGYWLHHYHLSGKSVEKELSFGQASRENLIINTFAPFFFFYAVKVNKPEYKAYATALLDDCRVENNTKTRLFTEKKKMLGNAAASQGVIHLYDNYCISKKCLKCGVAAAIINA